MITISTAETFNTVKQRFFTEYAERIIAGKLTGNEPEVLALVMPMAVYAKVNVTKLQAVLLATFAEKAAQ